MSAIVSGCVSKTGSKPLNKLLIDNPLQTEKELISSIEKLRSESKELTISNNMFRRQLSLNFEDDNNSVTEHHQKVIMLFFQTLPDRDNLSIILSVSPSSDDGFDAVNDAWVRIQALRSHLKTYSNQIEELYIPNQEPDTVTIQVLGGDSVK